ncbi:MAG: YceI family protein [Rhodobacteraceae bacterium]|nr:YceI family protein [Paracoccaceae bacterium]
MARRFRVPDFARAALVAGLAFWPLIAAAQDVPAIPEQVLTNDPSHTTVDFGLSHLGFSTYRGSFGDVAIKLTLDTAHPEAAKLDAVVGIDSLIVPNPPAGFLDTLLGPDWFDAAKYPEAHFVSDSITLTGPTTADIHGTLTLHGVTRTFMLKATFNGGYAEHPLEPRPRLGFAATGSFKRSDFDMGFFVPPAGETFGIGDAVTLTIDVEMIGAMKAPN